MPLGLLTIKRLLAEDSDTTLLSFSGYEGLSKPFYFNLIVGAQQPLCQESLAHKTVFFSAGTTDGKRDFNGNVYCVERLFSQGDSQYRYRLTLRPWFYFLSSHYEYLLVKTYLCIFLYFSLFIEIFFYKYSLYYFFITIKFIYSISLQSDRTIDSE